MTNPKTRTEQELLAYRQHLLQRQRILTRFERWLDILEIALLLAFALFTWFLCTA